MYDRSLKFKRDTLMRHPQKSILKKLSNILHSYSHDSEAVISTIACHYQESFQHTLLLSKTLK